jgi:hypothetical protein
MNGGDKKGIVSEQNRGFKKSDCNRRSMVEKAKVLQVSIGCKIFVHSGARFESELAGQN